MELINLVLQNTVEIGENLKMASYDGKIVQRSFSKEIGRISEIIKVGF